MAIIASITRHGILCHSELDQPIGRSLKVYGEWAEEELFLLSSFLSPGAVVLDVGANVGTHALAFSRFVTAQGRVLAFEAQDGVFDLLLFNMLLNGAHHVSCVHALVGRENQLRYLPPQSPGNKSAAVSFINVENRASEKNASTPLLPLQEITLDGLALERCDLIKIDVEAMELDVLLGARETMSRHRPPIYFEQTSARRFAEIFNLFQEADYTLYWHATDPFNKNNFRNHPHNIFGGTKEINVLALPTEKKSRWQRQTSDLATIENARYDPPPRCDPTSSWALPAGAYNHLSPPTESSLHASLASNICKSAETDEGA